MKYVKHVSLVMKTSMAVAILIVVLLGITNGFFYYAVQDVAGRIQVVFTQHIQETLDSQKTTRIKALRSQIKVNATILGGVMGQYIVKGPFLYDLSDMTTVLTAYMELPEIQAMQVVDLKDTSFAAVWRTEQIERGEQFPEKFSFNDWQYHECVSQFMGADVGIVRIYYTEHLFQKKLKQLEDLALLKMKEEHAQIRQYFLRVILTSGGGGILALLIGIVGAIFFSVRFTAPLSKLVTFANAIAAGNFSQTIDIHRKDEIGRLAEAFRSILVSMQDTTRIAESIAAGNLNIDVRKRSEHDGLMSALNLMINRLSDVLKEMGTLIQAIQAGRLASRGNGDNLNGVWNDLIVGVNSLIDAFVDPFTNTAVSLDRLAKGDIPKHITASYQGDFNTIKDNLNTLIDATHEVTRLAQEIATGDLTVEVHERSDQDMLMQALTLMVKNLNTLVSQIQQSGVQMASSTTQLTANAKEQEVLMTTQVEATSKVLNSVTEISNVAENLVQTMQGVASRSEDAAPGDRGEQTDLAHMEAAMRHMEDASKVISQRLGAIHEKAENITTVVTTISKVADQTNLLSLNAAIEAEKAGESGRGFTVVAREIRRLADQTAVATLNIDQMIREMQSAVASGVMEMDKFISEVRHSVEDIKTISTKVTLIINQVQALSPSFEAVNVSMTNLNDDMQETKFALHETYFVIEQLNDTARSLQEEISRFEVT